MTPTAPALPFDEWELKRLSEHLHQLKVRCNIQRDTMEIARREYEKTRETLNEAYAEYNTVHGQIMTLIHGSAGDGWTP